jgi:gliding motility-associated-like protein
VKPFFLLLFVLLVGFSAESFGQAYWVKKQAGGNIDETLDVVSDGSGNSFSVGYFSTGAEINGQNFLVEGLTDGFVSAVTQNGNELWSKSFGGPQSDRALSVAVDGSGNVLVSGFYTNTIDFGNGITLTSNGAQDAFLAKFDLAGNPLWARTGGSSGGSDRANGVAVDQSGNVFITGQFSGDADFSGISLNATDGTVDAFIVKYDPNGNALWGKKGTGDNLDRGIAITTDNSGSCYATGQFSGNFVLDNVYTNTIQNALFVVKYSSDGNEEWFRWGGGSEESVAYDIASNGSNIFITGDFGSSLSLLGDGAVVDVSSGYSSSIFITSISAGGNYNWTTTSGSNSNVSSRGIDVSSSGSIAIAGWFECTLDDYSQEYGEATFNSIGARDAFSAFYTSSGSFDWARNFGSRSNVICNSVAILNDGVPLLAGTNTAEYVVFPVMSGPVPGLPNLISNANSGITHCGDSNYGRFRRLNSSGGLDGFLAKILTPNRSPLDFYRRTNGECDTSIPEPCIYRWLGLPSFTNCSDDPITACAGFSVSATNYVLDSVGFDFTYQWQVTGGTDPITQINSSITETVTISSVDGCYSASTSRELEVLPEPDLPLITDSQGVNFETSSPVPIFICPDETVDIAAAIPAGYTFQWSGGQFGASPVFTETISVSEEGSYFISVSAPNGCTNVLVVNVIVLEVPQDVPPLIFFPTQNDTIQLCEGESFTIDLLNELNLEPYPAEEYEVSWTTDFGGIIVEGVQIFVNEQGSAWYVYSVDLESIENDCTDEIITHSATDSVYVNVLPNPDVELEISGPGFWCPGDTLTLFYEAVGNLILSFEPIEVFEDSLYISGIDTYLFTVDSTSAEGCTATISDSILVQQVTSPEIFTVPEEAIVCPNDSVLIATNSPGDIIWQGPSGIIEGEQAIYVQEPGLYFAETEFYEGCALVSNTIEVSEFTTPFLSGSNAVLCPGGEVEIEIVSTSLDDIEWQDPFSGSDSTQTVTEPGIYTVVVTGCGIETTLSIEVELSDTELAISVPNPAETCEGDSILVVATEGLESYQWIPEGNEVQEWFTAAGQVQVAGVDSNGCAIASNILTLEFEEVPGAPTFGFDQPCEGETVEISVDVEPLTVNFIDWPGGELVSNDPLVVIESISTDTTLYAFVSSEFCQGPVDSITISPTPFPEQPVPATDAPVCTGTGLSLSVLNAEEDVQYTWITADGTFVTGDDIVFGVNNLDDEGVYLVVADIDGCLSDTSSVEVSLFEARQVSLPPDTALCFRPDFLITTDTLYQSYSWNDNSSDSVFVPSMDTETIIVNVTDFNGCRSSDVMLLEFVDCTIDVSNIFTPNGDGRNDTWFFELDQPGFFDLVVYNRWGRVVYESQDHARAWDGTHYESGEPCSEGVYFYILRINDFEGKAFEQQGDLTLIRQ